MKSVILIGFQYGDFESNKVHIVNSLYLPGILVDLYQVYLFAKRMNPDKIIVITDIEKDSKTDLLLKAIVESIVDSDILTFIETIKESNSYYYYNDQSVLIKTITNETYLSDQLFLYYTGHAKEGYILLPNEQRIKMTDLRDIIISSLKPSSEIFIVMDCCNGTGMELPFRFIHTTNKIDFDEIINNRRYQQFRYQLQHTPNPIFTKQKIICISSTSNNEDSITTKNGSLFTQSLFRHFKSTRLLAELLCYISKECLNTNLQTVTIYSSYPDLYHLWPWLFSSYTYSIHFDSMSNTIILNDNISEEVEDVCFLNKSLEKCYYVQRE